MRIDPKTMLALFGALVFAGCGPVYVRSRGTVRAQATVRVAVPSSVVVTTAPPPLERSVAERPASPGANAVWVDGHYKWQEGRWVWTPGHWERDRPGVVWVPPVAEQRGPEIVYHPGYWCPVDQAPDPAYGRGSDVAVSVRGPSVAMPPDANATARPPAGGGTARVRPGGATATAPPATGGGSARVRPGTGAATPPSAGGSARVRPGTGSATASGGGSATVRGSGSTSTRSSGGSASVRGRASAGGSVTVRVGGGGSSSSGRTRGQPNRADDSTARARPRDTAASGQGGSARVTAGSAAGSQGGSSRVTAGTAAGSQGGSSRVTAGTTAPSQGGSARVNPGTTQTQGGARPADPRTTPSPQTRLSCSISTPRAPRNGVITIDGFGFSNRARVQIGGQYAIMRNRAARQLQVQIPGSSTGGAVRVIDGGRTASCGSIRVR